MRQEKRLTSFARELRHNQTDAERHLWGCLRDRRLNGLKFKRQQPVNGYIVDFICLDKMLAIELDGGQHATQPIQDNARTDSLNKSGLTVLRFWNNDVFLNLKGVLEQIMMRAADHTVQC